MITWWDHIEIRWIAWIASNIFFKIKNIDFINMTAYMYSINSRDHHPANQSQNIHFHKSFKYIRVMLIPPYNKLRDILQGLHNNICIFFSGRKYIFYLVISASGVIEEKMKLRKIERLDARKKIVSQRGKKKSQHILERVSEKFQEHKWFYKISISYFLNDAFRVIFELPRIYIYIKYELKFDRAVMLWFTCQQQITTKYRPSSNHQKNEQKQENYTAQTNYFET